MAASIPIAIAIALSPFAVIPAVLLLFTPRPRPTATAFVVGWLVGVSIGAAAGALLVDVLQLGKDDSTVLAWLRVVLAAVLVVLAIRTWLTRHASSDPPTWMTSIRAAEPRDAIRLGLVLSAANPKVLLLAVAGGGVIASEVAGVASQLLGVLVFAVVASVTVAAPLVAFVALGVRALKPLDRAGRWLDANSQALVAVVLLVIGAGLLVSGVQGLG